MVVKIGTFGNDLLLGTDATIDRIVVVTYTDKATAELRARIRRLLTAMIWGQPATTPADDDDAVWVLNDDARARLRDALDRVDAAPISTIHGFCQRVLADEAFAAGRAFDQEAVPDEAALYAAFLAALRERFAREPEDKEPLRPGAIYVAPPNYHLLIERGGTLSLSIDQPVNFSRPSIDVLFESAAHAFGAAVAAVVLSGSSADGALGLAAIARGGGAAVVQADAQYPLMPDEARRHAPSATALPAGEIAAHLARLAADRPARGPAP